MPVSWEWLTAVDSNLFGRGEGTWLREGGGGGVRWGQALPVPEEEDEEAVSKLDKDC